MKTKRIISMLLSLAMIISCLTAIPTIAQAATGFTNFVENGDMESTWDASKWVKSSQIEGPTIGPVADTDTANAGNTVLRFDGTTTTSGKLSYMRYLTKLAAGTKYYYSYKVRLAANDTNDTTATPLYLYTDLNSAKGTAARPKLSKNWEARSGIITPTSETNISFKVCNSDQQSSNDYNVKSVIYEIDDVVVYDLTNAKTITLPADATITSTDAVVTAKSVNYAMPGSTISLTYEKEGYTLTADTADMAKDGNTYTFTMGSSNVVISEIDATPSTEFVNLVDNSNFDKALTSEWVMSTSAEGKISIVADSKDATNKVLRVDCSENTKNISWVNYKDEGTGLAEGKYYMSCKIRLADVEQPEYDSYYAYGAAMSSVTSKYFGATRPEITKDGWTECYGVFDATANKSVGFKILFDPAKDSNNVAKAVYEIDDLVIYNLATAKNITVPEDVEFTSDNVVKSHDNTYYAVQGSEVAFTYAKDGYTLSAEGAELTQDGNEYTFTVDSTAVTISEIAPITSTEFENEFADPGFDGTYDSAVWLMSTSTNAKGEVSIVTDTKDAENKVLRIDCSSNGTESNKISYVNYKANGTGLAAGKYYMHCKIRLADVDQPAADNYYVYAASLGGADVLYWDATRPEITKDGWAECYGVFDAAANASVGFKIIYTQGTSNNNVGKAVYEIDDFTIYNLASASNIAVPAGVEFTSDNVVKSHDSTYYAINGNDVEFAYVGEGLESLYINGEEAVATDDVYSYTVDGDALVLAIANQADDDKVKYAYTAGTPYAIFEEDATFTMIVAGHSDDGVLNELRVGEVTGKAGDILDLSTVDAFKAVSGWANKTIFTWDGVDTLNAIRSKCVLKDL